ncbi:MAG: PAS domain S-box protein, partial [Chloroflexota bacterium]
MSGCLEGLHSAIAAPLMLDEQPIGCLVLGWHTDQAISPRQVRWAETMAGYGAILIDSAHSHALQLERTAELTAVIEHMPSGVLVVGADHQVQLRNTVARRIRGEQETTDRLIGRDPGYRMVDVDRAELLPDSVLPLSRALRGERVDQFEYILQRPDPLGDIRVFASAAPIYAGSQLTGAVMVYSDVTRERQLAADLAAREAHLRAMYDGMACGILVRRADGTISHINQAAVKILGVRFDGSGDLLAGWQRLREDGSEMPWDEWPPTRAFATGEIQRFPLCGLRAPDGTVRWLHLEAVPLKDADGNVLEVVNSIVDQSDQKRIEDQLRDQANFQQAVMNSLGEGLYATDEEGRVTYLNQAAEEMLGWTRAELVGRFAHSAFHYRRPNDNELSDDRCLMLQALSDSGSLRREDDLLLRRDGTLLPVRWTASAVITQGESTGLVVAFQDITERQRTQEALRASEQRYRTIVETSNEGICLVDAEARILYVNRRMQDLNGYTAAEQIGHPVDEFNIPETAEVIRQGFEDARQRGAPLQLEFEMLHKAGGKQWVLMSANS